MNLIESTINVDTGLAWESNLNASLTVIDGHNHLPGSGIQIPSGGININADLSWNGFNLTQLRSLRMNSQATTLTTALDLGCIYQVLGNLYYNNSGGTPVQITSGSSIVGTAGSITGLPSGTASAGYSAGTFVWQSATNTAANLDAGSIILRTGTTSSLGLTLSPPSSTTTNNTTITLPTVPTTGSQFLIMDTSGNMLASVPLANGITASMLAPSLTKSPTFQIFTSSSGTYTLPANCIYIEVEMCGGGGGGSSGAASVVAGTDGTASTFGSISANGGLGATGGGTSPPPGLGGGTSGVPATGFGWTGGAGSPGGGGIGGAGIGGPGGNNPLGGGGSGAYLVSGSSPQNGGNGAANTGAGGGGGFTQTGGNTGGSGGGAAGYVKCVFSPPSSTYSYSVGAGGGGGSGSTVGGTGGSGVIIVKEFYS